MRFRGADVAPYDGSWSDAEREALRLPGDLCDGETLARKFNGAASRAGQYAIATPIAAALGLTDLTPLDPAATSLDTQESRALCEAADQHLSVDGVRLSFVDKNTWLVTCANEISVLTEHADWLIGEPLRPNLPRGKDARLVERWMNELQMLLFSHPVNAAREERGLPPINVVWLWGYGSLLPLPQAGEGWGEGDGAQSKFAGNAPTLPPSPSPAGGRGVPTHLAALRRGEVHAWQNAWQIRSSEIRSADSVILGDSRPCLRLTPRKPSATSKLIANFQRKPTLEEVLTRLQQQL